MHDEERKAKHKPVGPFAPPLPAEVEDNGPEPMAVANDKQTIHSDSHLPTSAPMDQYDAEVARRYKQVPAQPARSREENTRVQDPPHGHTEPDARGWAHPKLDEEPEEETK